LSVTDTAIKNMPAATINSIPTTYFSSASASQTAALKNSPYYSSFSDSVKTAVATAAGTSTTSTSPSSDSNMNQFNIFNLIFCLTIILLI
jgi:hypothetical protein